MSDTSPPYSPAASVALASARNALATGQPGASIRLAHEFLRENPDDRDGLYVLAVAQRYAGQRLDALRTLDRLQSRFPSYARLYQERGHALRAGGHATDAIEAYREALQRNPALPASWRALAELLTATGDDAASVLQQAAAWTRLPAPVLAASSLFYDGDVAEAEQAIRRYLLESGDQVDGIRLLAQIGRHRGALEEAELLLAGALHLAPDFHAARFDYAGVLLERQDFSRALVEAQTLRSVDPEQRAFQILEANACVGLGKHLEAQVLFTQLCAAEPSAELERSLGHACKTLGDSAGAVAHYKAALRLYPADAETFWSLANLKTYRFSDEELGRMQAAESDASTAPAARAHLCFALGQAHDTRGEAEVAFHYYDQGNRLMRTSLPYHPERLERTFTAQQALCTRDFFAERVGFGLTNPAPIFIVGMPRAGSTLIEQILASHPDVEGTMELPGIPRLARELDLSHQGSGGYPGVLAHLSPSDAAALGQRYLESTAGVRSGRPRFIDKMPNNFRHISLIHLILPNAIIIDTRREALSCCFSNFKQLYAHGQEFSYDLTDMGRYYRAYIELMAHWDCALPGRILRIQHEVLVDHFEHEVRRLLAHCGLEFHPACLEFHQTRRSVRTASSEQVRQPINRSGFDRWQPYAQWLGPLFYALGPELAPTPPLSTGSAEGS